MSPNAVKREQMIVEPRFRACWPRVTLLPRLPPGRSNYEEDIPNQGRLEEPIDAGGGLAPTTLDAAIMVVDTYVAQIPRFARLGSLFAYILARSGRWKDKSRLKGIKRERFINSQRVGIQV